jgi:Siphovirus Gp157
MSNITLHAATELVRELLDQIDPETGELPAELEQARAVVATKAVAVVAYIVEQERNTAMAKEYAKELAAKIKSAEKRSDWLRVYLSEHMAALGITKIADERGIFSASLSIGRDKSVDVFDADQLPTDCIRVVPAREEPDKTAIRSRLDAGQDVPGARLVAKDRLTIK